MELTAKAALKREIKHLTQACGINSQDVLNAKVKAWGNFAYSPSEQESAKAEYFAEQAAAHNR